MKTVESTSEETMTSFSNPQGGGQIKAETSRQIVAARVICIFFMMSVHVSPGFNSVQYDQGDAMYWIGALWVDVLGRSSVPALSIVSGFLMSAHFGRRSFKETARDRFRTLCLPMLFWTALLAMLTLVLHQAADVETETYRRFFNDGLWQLVTQNLLFLYGQPSNVSLAFLRDLFVCSLLVVVLQQQMGRFVVLALPISVLLWQTIGYGDFILRPSILSFVLVGVALQRWRGHMTLSRSLRFVVRGLMVGVIAHHWFEWLAPLQAEVPPEIWTLIFRCTVSIFALDMALVLAQSRFFPTLRRWEPLVYLAYLSHGLVISVLWEALDPLVGGPHGATYPVFFLVSPVLALLTASLMAQVLDTTPAWCRTVISGKAAPRREHR